MYKGIYDYIANSDDNLLLSGLCKLIAFSSHMKQEENKNYGNSLVKGIIEFDESLVCAQSLDSRMISILEHAAKCEGEAYYKFRDGATNPADWDLEWDDYYVFNTIVNRRVCGKLKTALVDKNASGINALLGAANASSREG